MGRDETEAWGGDGQETADSWTMGALLGGLLRAAPAGLRGQHHSLSLVRTWPGRFVLGVCALLPGARRDNSSSSHVRPFLLAAVFWVAHAEPPHPRCQVPGVGQARNTARLPRNVAVLAQQVLWCPCSSDVCVRRGFFVIVNGFGLNLSQ